MAARINNHLRQTFAPPVMEARTWLAQAKIPTDRPLLNLSQAAPVDPPPEAMREEMARLVRDVPETHLYGPVLGLPALREALASRRTALYGGEISAEAVAITSGCNQAFCAAIASVAAAGDAVILPTPWYFNHKMWLDMAGIHAHCMPVGTDMLPDPDAARALVDARTRAIVLVTPNNPTGAEYPADLLDRFADLATELGLALIIDETYLDFHADAGPPHRLFQRPDWPKFLIHLYSFSKVFRLTGHRVGALIADPNRLTDIEKFLDTVTICPSQLGQQAALFGLREMGDWVAGERAEVLRRRAAAGAAFDGLPGWRLLGCGAYFAFVEHAFDIASNALAERLVNEQSLLLLPGTMFAPTLSEGGDGSAERRLRIAFANADADGITVLAERLRAFAP